MLVAEEAVEIRVLRRQGKSIREIARMLDVSRNTVRRYLRAEGPPAAMLDRILHTRSSSASTARASDSRTNAKLGCLPPQGDQ